MKGQAGRRAEDSDGKRLMVLTARSDVVDLCQSAAEGQLVVLEEPSADIIGSPDVLQIRGQGSGSGLVARISVFVLIQRHVGTYKVERYLGS